MPDCRERAWAPLPHAALKGLGRWLVLKSLPLCFCCSELQKLHFWSLFFCLPAFNFEKKDGTKRCHGWNEEVRKDAYENEVIDQWWHFKECKDRGGKSRRNSPLKSPRKSPSKSSSKKEKKKKPARPCMFCGQMQAQLKRHVIRKHQSHEQVRAAMQLPKAEQARAFDGIKKRGIYLIFYTKFILIQYTFLII